MKRRTIVGVSSLAGFAVALTILTCLVSYTRRDAQLRHDTWLAQAKESLRIARKEVLSGEIEKGFGRLDAVGKAPGDWPEELQLRFCVEKATLLNALLHADRATDERAVIIETRESLLVEAERLANGESFGDEMWRKYINGLREMFNESDKQLPKRS